MEYYRVYLMLLKHISSKFNKKLFNSTELLDDIIKHFETALNQSNEDNLNLMVRLVEDYVGKQMIKIWIVDNSFKDDC